MDMILGKLQELVMDREVWRKELDTTEWLNWTELDIIMNVITALINTICYAHLTMKIKTIKWHPSRVLSLMN